VQIVLYILPTRLDSLVEVVLQATADCTDCTCTKVNKHL